MRRRVFVRGHIMPLVPKQHIIGDYEFTSAEALTCGLSTCHREHWHGFVVATRDGFETHIGRDCAKRHCGLNWGELQSQFRKETDDRDRRLWLEKTVGERDTMLSDAAALFKDVEAITQKVDAVLNRLAKEQDILRAFRDAQKVGGAIRVEREIDKETVERLDLKPNQRHRMDTVGTLAAIEVTIPVRGSSTLPGKRIMLDLKNDAIPVLQTLTHDNLRNLSERKRKEKSTEVQRAQDTIGGAKRHLVTAARFLEPANLAAIGKIEVAKPNSRTERILRSFATGDIGTASTDDLG